MRQPEPIRYAPHHRRDWRRFGRRCICGLRWPCPDRIYRPRLSRRTVAAVDDELSERIRRATAWNAPTIAYPRVGDPGRLTPAQEFRANAGRRW
ncbi:hypothetical protein SAMN05444365_10110 [Micromonospora pattaloongensis]|uniref:Uncharacterized protein n=1 Tax=Micromonospora pattaloongensis TaxID=405436 RepID=A0A1H3FHY8_9ACTN|nr:hypothetical protein [Micromonospora pattaloongensis]SDX90367.1 hypothetical protein SAMN05444365_10110 [Micromonospora pattaloongensis]